MTKKEALIYAVLINGDIYKDGYGTTNEDEKLLNKILKTMYNITENSSDDDKIKADNQIEEDIKALVIEYRGKAIKLLSQ